MYHAENMLQTNASKHAYQAGEPDRSTVTTAGRPTGHLAPRSLLCDLPADGSSSHCGAATPSDWCQVAGEEIGSSRIAWPTTPSSPAKLPPQCPSDTCGGATAEPSQAQRGARTAASHGGRQLKLHELRRVQPQVSGGESPNPHPPVGHGRSPTSSARLGAHTEIDRQVSCNQEALGKMQGGTLPFMLEVSTRGAAAQKAYDLFDILCHQGAWHLVGGSLRHERIQRTPLAQAVAQAIR